MTGLTEFLIALDRADPSKLAKADAAKLAAKYQIREQDAAGYLKLARGW